MDSEDPETCLQCKTPKPEIAESVKDGACVYADEHRIGATKDVNRQVIEGQRANTADECTEAGMYLAMSRQADCNGYPASAGEYRRCAFEETKHAAKCATLIGEVVMPTRRKTLNFVPKRSMERLRQEGIDCPREEMKPMMSFMTPSMRWRRTRRATEKASEDCLSGTSGYICAASVRKPRLCVCPA